MCLKHATFGRVLGDCVLQYRAEYESIFLYRTIRGKVESTWRKGRAARALEATPARKGVEALPVMGRAGVVPSAQSAVDPLGVKR